ncbi:hypothetical protein [Phaeacidiphilus oryzae]|uniref:hypothetical protein n=1 Tax=Phaeacidiphilus oryzae TaxID=348818 RepID=UPI00068C0470|nr:hypothetical protein [Phaeacidiphilus oryzae]
MKQTPAYERIAAVAAALLCAAVAVIHVQDQGGFPGDKTPGYVGIGYYLLEVVGILVAVVLVFRPSRRMWFLAAGVGLGPLVGFVLSRGPGLPDYTDDVGNWTEPLAVISVVVEVVLIVVAAAMYVLRHKRTERLATASSAH